MTALRQPKIALFDIETAPSLGYFWGKLYETDIIQVHSPWYMLCFAYKWLETGRIHTHSLRDYPGYRRDPEDDRRLVGDLHKLFDEADILIAHNGDRFDIRKANAKFIKYGMRPPSHYRTIDTLKIARKHFLFDGNRLDALGQYLGFGGKRATTGFDLWRRCMAGEIKAWEQMEQYNRRDVDLLEDVYLKLRPYATTHPNMAVLHDHGISRNHPGFAGGVVCPRCQSIHTVSRGVRYSNTRAYKQHTCRGCGHHFQGEVIRESA